MDMIYVVWFQVKKRNRKGEYTLVEHGKEVIFNNLEHAQEIYKDYKNNVETWEPYAGYTGVAGLANGLIGKNGSIDIGNEVLARYET